jgi:hypothetical protein
MALIERSLINKAFFDQRNMIQRVHVYILIISKNEDDVRPAALPIGLVLLLVFLQSLSEEGNLGIEVETTNGSYI